MSLHVVLHFAKWFGILFGAGVATSFAESHFDYSLYEYVKAGVLKVVHLFHKDKPKPAFLVGGGSGGGG